MKLGKRVYWAIGLVAVLAIAFSAVTVTSRLTSAGGSTPSADACDQQDAGGDAAEATQGPDTGTIGLDDAAEVKDAPEANDAAEVKDAPEADDAAEVKDAPDTDNIDEQCGPQDAQD